MRRKLVALLAAPMLFAVACGGSDEDSTGGGADGGGGGEVDQVTVGVIPIVDVAPIYLGVEQGFFEEEGIDVTLESGQGGAAIVPGVVSGEFEFGFSNVTSVLLAAQEGVPLKVIANGVASTGEQGADYGGVVVSPDSGITDAAGLAGKRVAVNTLNNIGTTTVRASVREAGGDPEAVEFVELPFPDMGAALDQGNVDAIWVVEPFLTLATQAGGEVIASNFVDAADDLTVATYFTSQQLIQEDADLVERFVAALERSLEFAQENPDEVRAVLGTYTQIDQAVIDAMILPAWPTEINRESIEQLAELGVEDGLLDEAPDLDALLP
jgi:NitT/TauT family transport system substrate-binding protein